MVTNAVYFKGLWAYPFKEWRTQTEDFAALTATGVNQVCDTWCKESGSLLKV
jgi:serine protease inhibitor